MRLAAISIILTLAASGACARQKTADAVGATNTSSATAGTGGTDASIVTGTVVETMDASGYTYMRIDSGTGESWVATGQFKVAVGDRVVAALDMPMKDFHSRTLNRDFPLIYFVTRIAHEGQPLPPVAAAEDASASGQPTSSHSAVEPATPVSPAEGGTTVADVWKKRTALAGKTVIVRGRVAKFSSNILDRNWAHIQDGTGAADDGTNDLTVTTTATVVVGDVIIATGKVAVNKDFGAGYVYSVILEDATIAAK